MSSTGFELRNNSRDVVVLFLSAEFVNAVYDSAQQGVTGQVPVLAQHYMCITFDHRGHGTTRDFPADDPGAVAYAEDLAGLWDAWQ